MAMAKRSSHQPVMKRSNLPFEVTAQMRFYFPICDYNPYAAYLLDYCYGLRTISLYEYQQKQDEEEARLAAMSPEDREAEQERIFDEALEKWEDRQLNEYSGESWLNDENDADEGVNGIFYLDIPNLARIVYHPYYTNKTTLEELETHFWEACRLLRKKGFLDDIASSAKLDLWAIEGALRGCYPELYEQEENEPERSQKRESAKVQYHVNMANRLGLPATLTLPEWLETLAHFGWKCAYCRKAPYAVLEHIQPMVAGGGTTPFNCVPACAECNLLKHDIPPELLPPGFDAALEKIQHYLKKRKLRYVQQLQERFSKNT
jgi:hypothetical protein